MMSPLRAFVLAWKSDKFYITALVVVLVFVIAMLVVRNT